MPHRKRARPTGVYELVDGERKMRLMAMPFAFKVMKLMRLLSNNPSFNFETLTYYKVNVASYPRPRPPWPGYEMQEECKPHNTAGNHIFLLVCNSRL